MSSYYISELDNKPIERQGSGWFTSKAKAVLTARQAVKVAPEPVFVAVVDGVGVVHRVASADHPDAEHADELVEVHRETR